MNTVQDSKEWQMPSNPLPSPSVADGPMHSSAAAHYPPMDQGYTHPFPHSGAPSM